MKGFLLFTSWIFCYILGYAQERIIPESEYDKFSFTYEQMCSLVKESYNRLEIPDNIIHAYYDSIRNQYYWREVFISDSYYDLYYEYMEVNATTGVIQTQSYGHELRKHSDSGCNVYYDPDLKIMKRRLLANFETVDWKEYNKYKKEEGYSERMITNKITAVWEKGDTAFIYYETFPYKKGTNIFLLKEFYANGNIKEKGINAYAPNCPRKIGLWYYFNPEGELTDVIDENAYALCIMTDQEIIAFCKERFGYREDRDNEYRLLMAGLPDIQINRTVDYYDVKSRWKIYWYDFDPGLVKIELNLEGQSSRLTVISWSKTCVSLEKEIERFLTEAEAK